MLLRGFPVLFSDPGAFFTLFVAIVTALVIGITVHECSHALTAYQLGDRTAARQGRLSLNPSVHLDPLGTVMLLVAGFGWGKPVPVDPRQLRNGRQGMAMVSLAGPLSNLVVAAAFALPFQLGLLSVPPVPSGWDAGFVIGYVAYVGVLLNVVLAVFNLLPFFPLDGSAVVMGLAPGRWVPALSRLQLLGPVLLVGVILLDVVFDLGLLWRVMGPVVNWTTGLLIG